MSEICGANSRFERNQRTFPSGSHAGENDENISLVTFRTFPSAALQTWRTRIPVCSPIENARCAPSGEKV